MVPTPGRRERMFSAKMKTKRPPKYQKPRSIVTRPVMPSRKSLMTSTIHSTKFCRPLGISLGERMAIWTTTMMTRVAMASATIELLISKPSIEKRSTGFGVIMSDGALWAASANNGATRVILRPKNGEGTSLRESDFRQEQDYGIFHKTEVKNLMIDAENC